jgi:hypothetical protein
LNVQSVVLAPHFAPPERNWLWVARERVYHANWPNAGLIVEVELI